MAIHTRTCLSGQRRGVMSVCDHGCIRQIEICTAVTVQRKRDWRFAARRARPFLARARRKSCEDSHKQTFRRRGGVRGERRRAVVARIHPVLWPCGAPRLSPRSHAQSRNASVPVTAGDSSKTFRHSKILASSLRVWRKLGPYIWSPAHDCGDGTTDPSTHALLLRKGAYRLVHLCMGR